MSVAQTARFTSRIRASTRVPLLQVGKSALATVLAWLIAGLILPTQLPVFGAIAALLVVQPSVNQSVGRAIERSFGVIAGVVIAFGIGLLFGANSIVVLVGVVLAIFIGWALRLTPASASQIPISVMLVLSIGASNPEYSLARIAETLIGAAIGLVVNIAIVPPVHLEPAREAVASLGIEIAASLDRLATALRHPQTIAELNEMLITARLLRPMQTEADELLEAADESLTFNPRAQANRAELASERALLARMNALITRVLGMSRAVHDHYDPTLIGEPTVVEIAGELDRAAHDLRLVVQESSPDAVADLPPLTQAVPLLTAPLQFVTPHPRHWVLIGSLTEDLRRVHEEIVGTEP